MLWLFIFAAINALAMTVARPQPMRPEVKLGALYASSGQYSKISLPLHYGLKLWIDQRNAEDGTYVKAFEKKIPLKLIEYDDESNGPIASKPHVF
jgi:branched-chain amino acid transport system substrate-binding protein